MPLDPSFVGRSYPPTPPYEVGREKIREFADALGDTNPIYRDVDAARAGGHPDVIAPPTFPMVLTWPASQHIVDDPELGLDFDRVVHGNQRFQHHRPMRAGDRLSCTVTVETIKSVAGNDLITTRTEVLAENGDPVTTAWSTLVVRGPEEESADGGTA
ncbi:MAG: MaoC family dehydratase N-terminal domain-containing protein [Actinocatenispora sp.]